MNILIFGKSKTNQTKQTELCSPLTWMNVESSLFLEYSLNWKEIILLEKNAKVSKYFADFFPPIADNISKQNVLSFVFSPEDDC